MEDLMWLAVDYHMPMTYSCRKPMNSPYSAQILPAPGPTTVRLALIREAIELFGLVQTKRHIYSILKTTPIHIRPPKAIGISTHHLRMYKPDSRQALGETIGYREYAHSSDPITIYALIPKNLSTLFSELFDAIGYWGQADSFATCTRIYESEPDAGDIIHPLNEAPITNRGLKQVFTAFVTEWDLQNVTWEMITGEKSGTFFQTRVYVYPLFISKHHSSAKRLLYRSLESNSESVQ